MLSQRGQKRMRKGTKSCRECRRRKIRCCRAPEDAPKCRRCEEIGVDCVAQSENPQSPYSKTFSTRHRVSDLEHHLARLKSRVYRLEFEAHGQTRNDGHDELPDRYTGETARTDIESDDYDSESWASDIVDSARPTHLSVLFENEQLSAQRSPPTKVPSPQDEHQAEALLNRAREALQNLIPAKEDLAQIAASPCDWLRTLHQMFPQACTPNSGQEIMNGYAEMCGHAIDPFRLALWLLVVSMLAQQTPQGASIAVHDPKICRDHLKFSAAVSDAVEQTLFCHDRLLGTVQGVAVGTALIRLNIGRGLFQKAWLQVRRAMGAAELMGLPRRLQSDIARHTDDAGKAVSKLEAWGALLAIESVLGMMLSISTDTRHHLHSTGTAVTENGVVSPRLYLTRLIEIVGKIQQLEDIHTSRGSQAELDVRVAELSGQLKQLESEAPPSWWALQTSRVETSHVVQFLHCCTVMRAYLPSLVRQGLCPGQVRSWSACLEACLSITTRYQFLRRRFPAGIFVSRLLDIQTFTATVILLLASNTPAVSRAQMQFDEVKTTAAVTDVIQLMRQQPDCCLSSRPTRRIAATLSALHDFLRQDGRANQSNELTVHVPLLGKMQITLNSRAPETLESADPTPLPMPSGDDAWWLGGFSLESDIGFGGDLEGFSYEGDVLEWCIGNDSELL